MCRRRVRDTLARPVLWLLVTAALAGALVVGVKRVQEMARERGEIEAARDLAPKPSKGGRVVIAPLVTAASVPSAGGAAAPSTTVAPIAQPMQLGVVEASAASPPAQNGCGEQVTYQASQVSDGSPETAWRVAGDGRAASLTVSLAAPGRVTAVGLIPGYDKIDRCTNADRFLQLRRVIKVRWKFDDGSAVEQTFQDARTLQVVQVDVTTARIVIEILATSGGPELDFTAVSEVRVFGVRAPA